MNVKVKETQHLIQAVILYQLQLIWQTAKSQRSTVIAGLDPRAAEISEKTDFRPDHRH